MRWRGRRRVPRREAGLVSVVPAGSVTDVPAALTGASAMPIGFCRDCGEPVMSFTTDGGQTERYGVFTRTFPERLKSVEPCGHTTGFVMAATLVMMTPAQRVEWIENIDPRRS